MTSKERLLNAISFQDIDHVPLAMLQFEALRMRCPDEEQFVKAQLDLELDPLTWFPYFVWGSDPGVKKEVWKEEKDGKTILHKKFITPKGNLEAATVKTEDWPYGDDIPLASDWGIARNLRFPVNDVEDLPTLEWMLADFSGQQISEFRQQAKITRQVSEKYQVPIRAGGTRMTDTIAWLCGCEGLSLMGIEKPDLLRGLLDIIWKWHRRGMEVVLSEKPDLYWHGDWYAGPFLNPAIYEEFFLPVFQKHVEMVHQAGIKFVVMGTTNMMPYIKFYKQMGVDAIYGLDPVQGNWDLPRAKAECGREIALWGGINAYLQVVDGTTCDVEMATRKAMELFAPGGGFILSPIDDTKIWDDGIGYYAEWPKVEENIRHMVKVWKELR